MDEAQRFGRYKVTGSLGRGAMGHVYAAVDDVLGRSVAVKTLHGGASGVGARLLDERFRLEARAIAALNHPGIVQVYDLDLTAVPPYLVMERVAGPSLKEQFERGPLAANELRALGIQIGRALAAAHAAGIVHRDVKPANILVAGGGTWKLADFGVAHVPDSSLTMTGQFLGSPAYAPPEALLRGQSTAAGDVFGLGATLYYGAAGSWPRSSSTVGGLLAPIPSVRELAPHLPDDLVATIDRAVEIEPDRRPTAAALADALAGATPLAETAGSSVGIDTTPLGLADREATHRLAPTRPPPAETVFVADSTETSQPTVAAPVRPALPARRRWQRVALGAVALAGVAATAIALGTSKPAATASRSAAPPPSVVTPPAEAAVGSAAAEEAAVEEAGAEPPAVEEPAPALEQPPPGQIRAFTPPIRDRHAADDWNDIVQELYEQNFRKARQKLEAWDRRWGQSAETRSLRQQLDALPPEALE